MFISLPTEGHQNGKNFKDCFRELGIFFFALSNLINQAIVAPMDIRQIQYLAALAREKHFIRAAQACNVTHDCSFQAGRSRQVPGVIPVMRLKARMKAASDS